MLLSLVFIHLLMLISPGPDFAMVLKVAISQGRKPALMVSLGTGAGISVWIVATLFGLSALLKVAAWLQGTMMLLGGCYLSYIAWQSWQAWRNPSVLSIKHTQPIDSADTSSQKVLMQAFAKGFLTNLSNPKAVIYFGSIFSIYLPIFNTWQLQLELVLILAMMQVLWFACVSYFLTIPSLQQRYQKLLHWLDLTVAAVFGCFGLGLIFESLKLLWLRPVQS